MTDADWSCGNESGVRPSPTMSVSLDTRTLQKSKQNTGSDADVINGTAHHVRHVPAERGGAS
ncbi:MAG: hypothetical protein ACRDNS_29825, partial [Trebonia sp.]